MAGFEFLGRYINFVLPGKRRMFFKIDVLGMYWRRYFCFCNAERFYKTNFKKILQRNLIFLKLLNYNYEVCFLVK